MIAKLLFTVQYYNAIKLLNMKEIFDYVMGGILIVFVIYYFYYVVTTRPSDKYHNGSWRTRNKK